MNKEWKHWQQLYNRLMRDHSDDQKSQRHVVSDEIVENALNYLQYRSEIAVYPAKSYIVAIIYATLLNKEYGEDFYDVLNDPMLLNGQDEYFVPYEEDRANYDAIIARLLEMPNWMNGGWAPQTVSYFYLECTPAGVESINGV